MATFLDLSLFQHVSSVFIFLFIFLIVYAFLGVSKIFKDISGHNGIYALIALMVAFLSSFSKGFVSVISTMTPWFTVIIVFFFLVFFVLRMFTTDDAFFEEMLKKGALKWVMVVVFVVILLVSVSSAFGQQMLDNGSGGTTTTTTPAQEGGAVYESGTTTTATTTTADGVATNDFGTNMMQTLFHPKVLGMLLIIMIAFFTILLIARTPSPD